MGILDETLCADDIREGIDLRRTSSCSASDKTRRWQGLSGRGIFDLRQSFSSLPRTGLKMRRFIPIRIVLGLSWYRPVFSFCAVSYLPTNLISSRRLPSSPLAQTTFIPQTTVAIYLTRATSSSTLPEQTHHLVPPALHLFSREDHNVGH